MHYVKIYSGILDSSIAELDVHVRWLWIVLLTKADQYGNVYGTPQALARAANLSVEDTLDGINKLMVPDPSSTTEEQEGRRIIQESPNLWHVVNYLKYRVMRDPVKEKELGRERVRRFREKQKEASARNGGNENCNAMKRHVEVEVVGSKQLNPIVQFVEWYKSYPKHEGKEPARKAWLKLSEEDRQRCLEDSPSRYALFLCREKKFWPLPATFLNQRRWEDEVGDAPSVEKTPEDLRALENARRQLEDDSDIL